MSPAPRNSPTSGLAPAVTFVALYPQARPRNGGDHAWLSPWHNSAVTLATQGHRSGSAMSAGVQTASMLEVVIGYVNLGGTLSTYTTKVARRAR